MIIKGNRVVSSDVQANAEMFIFRGSLTAATTTAVGGVLSLKNETGYDLLVKLFATEITTGSTGIATIDLGVDDGGDVSSDLLIDGVNAQTVAIAANTVGGGTNGRLVRWKKNEYVVGTASATTAGMVGTYYIEAAPLA